MHRKRQRHKGSVDIIADKSGILYISDGKVGVVYKLALLKDH